MDDLPIGPITMEILHSYVKLLEGTCGMMSEGMFFPMNPEDSIQQNVSHLSYQRKGGHDATL